MLSRRRTGARLTLLAVLIAGAVGLAMIIVGLGGPTGWALIAPRVAAVLMSLGGIYCA
jgi:hypothetical protein